MRTCRLPWGHARRDHRRRGPPVARAPRSESRARRGPGVGRAAGINAADLMQRQGLYPAPPGYPADIPGMEFAGEVVALGSGYEPVVDRGPGHVHHRRRGPGRVGGDPGGHRHGGARRHPLGPGRRVPRGLLHRPGRPLHPGPSGRRGAGAHLRRGRRRRDRRRAAGPRRRRPGGGVGPLTGPPCRVSGTSGPTRSSSPTRFPTTAPTTCRSSWWARVGSPRCCPSWPWAGGWWSSASGPGPRSSSTCWP